MPFPCFPPRSYRSLVILDGASCPFLFLPTLSVPVPSHPRSSTPLGSESVRVRGLFVCHVCSLLCHVTLHLPLNLLDLTATKPARLRLKFELPLRSLNTLPDSGFACSMSVSSTSSRADEVHQANLATFRAFRKTIDELIQWPSAPLGDQAGLVRRLQEWRKAIGHITLWVSDARAYYGRARPEIVYLLEVSVLAYFVLLVSKYQFNRQRMILFALWTEHELRSKAVPYFKLAMGVLQICCKLFLNYRDFCLLVRTKIFCCSSDYIRLIEAAFGPQRQSLYDTPADQEPLSK